MLPQPDEMTGFEGPISRYVATLDIAAREAAKRRLAAWSHAMRAEGAMDPSGVTDGMLGRWLIGSRSDEAALPLLLRFWRWMRAERIVGAELPRMVAPSKVPAVIGEDELRTLLAAGDARSRAIVLLFSDTGCRTSELCQLTLSSLDMRRRRVSLGGSQRHSARVLALSERLHEALRSWLVERERIGAPSELVFVNAIDGEGLAARTVQQIVRQLGRQVGIVNVTPHGLRHTYYQGRLDDGWTADRIRQSLGLTRHPTWEPRSG